MSGPPIYSLGRARRLADTLIEGLSPGCERIEVKGSIAREARAVGDIELVALPKIEEHAVTGQQAGLFTDPRTEQVSMLWLAVNDLVAEGRIIPLKPSRILSAFEAEKAEGETVELTIGRYAERDARWEAKRLAGSRYFKLWIVKARIQLDLFMPASADTWGSVATIRTGSAAFSKALVSRWKNSREGRRFRDGIVYDHMGAVIPTPEEPDVFHATGFAWVDPPRRHGWNDLVPVGRRSDR